MGCPCQLIGMFTGSVSREQWHFKAAGRGRDGQDDMLSSNVILHNLWRRHGLENGMDYNCIHLESKDTTQK
jgi:hypothetical protein